MAVNNQTLGVANQYTDEAIGAHEAAANPHPQYARLVDGTGAATGGALILLAAGAAFPAVQPGSVLVVPGPNPTAGVYIVNQTGTGWVLLGTGQPAVDSTPPTTPGSLHSTAVTVNSITVAWNASTDTESGLARYDVALGAAGAFVTNGTALTKTFTGLAAGTQYTIRVRAVDAAGNLSSEASVQVVTTSAGDTTPPGAPPAFRVASVTTSSVGLAWDAATDTGGGTVTRYEVSKDSTSAYTSVGLVLSTTMSALLPNTSYTFRVRAVDSSGNISPASQLTVTTNSVTPVQVSTLMGINVSTQGTEYTNWDAWRCYTLNGAAALPSKGAKVIALTDDPVVSRTGGATSASQLRSHLMSFYGKTGTPSSNANVQTHFGNGNEVDAETLNATAFANTYELMETVVADFPMASLWFDATIFHLNQGITETMLNYQATSGRRIYQMLDGLAGSYYPPKRTDYPNISAASFTAPSGVVDPYMALMVKLGLRRAAIWEWGIPIAFTPPPAFPNPGTTYKDVTKRPAYVTQFLNYWFQACIDNGITPEIATYWDKQIKVSGVTDGTSGNTNPDNRLQTDQTRTSPNTATTWRNAVTTFNAG